MRNKGFTLLEVTLVIVIGIVLIAGASAMFTQYRNQARVNQGKLNMSALRQAVELSRYRTGAQRFPMGFVGSVQSIAGLVITTNSAPDTNYLPAGTVLCFGGTGTGTVTGRVGSVGPTSITLGGAATGTITNNTIIRAGLLGNVDDQCNKLVPIPDPNPTVAGMGLSDPWLGYTNVRPSPAANLPEFRPGIGFVYNDTRYRNGTEVWGGLVYLMDRQTVEYVLPAPNVTPTPPANLGRFPGDPPINWGSR